MTTEEAKRFQSAFFSKVPNVERLTSLMAGTPSISIYVKNDQSCYIFANESALATYDLEHEQDLIGRHAHDFFPPILADAYEAEDRRVMDQRVPVQNEVWLVPHIRGTPRWFVSSKTPVMDTTNKVIGLFGIMHPIASSTERLAHFQELHPAMQYIDENYLGDIRATELADIAGLSAAHFNRRFREILRLSPMNYIHTRRVQEAQRLLATSDQSAGEIAVGTGFFDQSHFTKRFNKSVGMTPLAYRKRYRKA
ncbi:AraC family transcriptional regulator [Verrucomicrobia bacterium]|nr:AraC family transcriptional regulator [Verrucomicrobiota bacterium]